ncbi:hypothetical protein HYPSUDRAFT_213859 [Hypholoma sublateritium FD-334 SS-4]|uniref:Uncharacterized protein n=1 Tax=Hypholoma sublateritium (strain FD-334 SS-4) TaxID=945553 RepID=A0A0D2MNK4_HYPSF|nr:hypothetical protein HYPSUDRAFT_213859 [Hypholoma sublateritium FD-334 SS-4]
MAGAFSGHLINQYNPNNPSNSSIVSHGAMSFNPNMHGTPQGQRSFSFFGNDSSFANDSISEESARKLASLQVKLNQKLGPEYISQRPGPGGGPKLTYVEGWKIINLANEVFGFNGWSSSIVTMTVDFADYNEESRRFNVGVTAVMRVTLRDGVFHEDVGYGMLENSKSKGQALDKCKKEAVTDGLKRALRSFGNVMGNCLYDKSYASEIVKVKFEPKKFNKDELHRRPEFEDVKPNFSSSSINTSTSSASMGSAPAPRAGPSNYNTSTPTRPPVQQNKPITSLPPHMRSEAQASGSVLRPPANPNISCANANGKAPAQRPVAQPPQPPPQPAKATAALPPAPAKVELDDEDDSFGYNSDDDALIAMADLGPAIDADMGRPIDHEEGLLQPPPDDDEPAPPVRAREPSAGMTRHELIAAALAGDPPTELSAMAGLPYAEFKPMVPRPSGGTSAAASVMLGMRPPPPPQPRSTTSLVQQNHQRYMSARPQDQNRAPAPQAGERVPSPSAMGGFNFPGGASTVQGGVSGMSLSGVGMKRPADAMSSSTSSGSSFRGGRPGMGLPQTSSGPTANKRNILGALDITDGGDVKRPRF